MWAQRTPGSDGEASRSGHSSRLGYVTGGQARQGHLHGGALPGPPLSWRRFAGAQAVAGVSHSSADDDSSTAAAAVLQHGPPTHLVHQTVDLILSGAKYKKN